MKPLFKIVLLPALLAFCVQAFAQKQGLEAIDSLKQDLAANTEKDTNQVRLIYRIADGYSAVSSDSAMVYLTRGLSLAKQLNWQKGIAAFYNNIGNIYNDNSDYAKALKYYNNALKINTQIKNVNNIVSNLNNLGSVYQRKGNYAKSQEYNFEALKAVNGVNSPGLIALINYNIANIYFIQNDLKKALVYFNKSLKIYQQENDDRGVANIYKSIANIYNTQNQASKAASYYTKALVLYRNIDNKIGEATVLSQLGILYDNNPDKKLGYLLQAEKIFDEVSPLYTTAITNIGNIGGTYAAIFINRNLSLNGRYENIPDNYTAVAEKALLYLNKAVDYSKEAGDSENLSYFADNLAQLQEKTGQYKSALENFKLSKSIDDSLYSQESKNKIAELEAGFLFQKKENDYKQKQEIASFKMRQIILYSALAIIIISSILIYYLNRARISQLKLKNEIQKKEAEEQTRELLHRNKLSESELKAIRSQMNPHFIFNVLNSIESYILENDSQTASRLVQKFASLSRLILENSTQSMVTADREWRALKLYTELEAIRFNNQFTYTFTADPLLDLAKIMLPPMLVQPLIENSIHHGLRNSTADDKHIEVKLGQTEVHIIFTVDDNGIGIDASSRFKTYSTIKSKSIGLAAIKERIDIINNINDDNPASFTIHKKQEGGTIAILTLPKVTK
ncbi:MAG: tetratricopeptide repeat protein [Sphingobacteriaceae bacterium]|nr:MAG: tetratricopeptide repeat protein [Sphingobacteriaceae bacterium]